MLYRDEHWNFYFSDRIKLMLKYKNHQVSPVEIQNVIRQHPGVLDVVVTGLTDPECGDLPVACVVRQLKDLVKDSLTDSKQLRGGVVFLDAIPVTATTKVDYRTLKKLIIDMEKQ